MKKMLLNAEEIGLFRNSLFSATHFVFIPVGRSFVRVFLCDIIWIESKENYVKFHTYNGSVLSLFSMKMVMNKLPGTQFSRVNRSVIVNIAWVAFFDKDGVTLINGLAFSFGEGGKKRLSERINLL